MRRVIIAVLSGTLAACPGGEEPPDPGPGADGADPGVPSAAADDLATSLIARVEDARVAFALNVTNAGGAPIRLDFNSGQRFDVSVTDAGGAEVWRWSADRSFIQSLGSETVEPGATLTYRAEWAGAAPGTYRATGLVTASNRDIRQEVEVRVSRADGR